MFNFSTSELVMILVIALVVFGPGKLPEVGKALGKGLGEFRSAMSSDQTKAEPISVQAKLIEKENEIQPTAKKSE
jgi:sec-independent protein translocase protein TatA